MKKVKRIRPLSLAKVFGALNALMGLILGLIIFLFAIGASVVDGTLNPGMLTSGIIAPIALTLIYGIFGFVFGLIGALFYNLASRWVGGLEIELSDVEEILVSSNPEPLVDNGGE